MTTTATTISGATYDEISGGGFWQTEHADIAAKFHRRKVGYGFRLTAELTDAERELLRYELIAQAELLESGGTDDDAHYRRIAAGLRRDAERIRPGEEPMIHEALDDPMFVPYFRADVRDHREVGICPRCGEAIVRRPGAFGDHWATAQQAEAFANVPKPMGAAVRGELRRVR